MAVSRRRGKPGNPKARWRAVAGALETAFRSPTGKQQEAYARYCHTLSAAVLIAGGAIPFATAETTPSVILRVVAAGIVALLLFAWGALLLEER
jgi:fructose-specific phosphotransferase system IIC component